jgi:hypothetical protein
MTNVARNLFDPIGEVHRDEGVHQCVNDMIRLACLAEAAQNRPRFSRAPLMEAGAYLYN